MALSVPVVDVAHLQDPAAVRVDLYGWLALGAFLALAVTVFWLGR